MCTQSLGWEDPLEYEMGTHSSILAWEIPWTEDTGGLQVHRVAEMDMAEHTHTHIYILVDFTFAELCKVGLTVRQIKFVLYGQFFMQKPIEFMPPDHKYFQESNFLLILRI